MTKKRTGLQSEISGIFKGVPVPGKLNKKDTVSSELPALKPDTPIGISQQETVQVIPSVSTISNIKIKRKKDFFSSKRQKTSLIFLIILSLSLVFVLAKRFYVSKGNFKTFQTGIASQQVTASIPLNEIKLDWPIPSKYPEDIRDPMKIVELETPGPEVKFTVNINGSLFIVAEGKLAKEGDTVNGVSVVKINQKSVEFEETEENGRSWTQKTTRLAVRGIVYSDNKPLAVVGIDTVGERDTVKGVKVVKINQHSVEFEVDGVKWTQEVEGKADK